MKFVKLACVVTIFSFLAACAEAQSWTESKYGSTDMAGASNLMTPDKALQATALIKTGSVLSLGRDYTADMPLFGARVFAVRGTRGLAGGPLGSNSIIWMDDFIATEIGQVGTQFDGLSHIGIGGDHNLFYNGTPMEEVFGGTGTRKLGIEHVKPFFTRGIVLDFVALKGRNLEAGEEITVADIEDALKAQGLAEPGTGDVVLLHTGWGRHWIADNVTFNSGEPGIGLEAAAWLIARDIAIVGADTWTIEVLPNPDNTVAFPVHMELIPKNGIFIHENIATQRLIAAGVSEFAYIFAPVPIAGATGSPGAPLAAY
ncbi:cyclase family protein [Mameliella sediminis]|uniref:cyclase family protein n=1 Tax=Mameliella sediminis TaxID=2836866 RepID=UPI001C47E43C|nr:cyclase family protein [Mameliella sediminis]MBV7393139.1 cyclase family protein [Mameliella sediminis]